MTDLINKANQLCMSCGMCCDGTMFKNATVESDEKQLVESVGLIVNEKLGEFSFEQPCKYYCKNQCAIYLQRPPVCNGFRCQLLKKLNRDEISFEMALEKVTMVRALQKGLVDVMPNAKYSPITSADVYEMAATINQNEPSQRMQNGVFLMLATKFIGLLTDHFWRKEKLSNPVLANAPDILQNPNHKM